MTRESKSKMPSRLEAYTKIGKQTSAIGAFGIAAVAVTGAADAALQTWTVGQNFGYNNRAATAGADLALTATPPANMYVARTCFTICARHGTYFLSSSKAVIALGFSRTCRRTIPPVTVSTKTQRRARNC